MPANAVQSLQDALAHGRVLCLDCVGPDMQVALFEQGQMQLQDHEQRRHGHAAALPPRVHQLLQQAKVAPRDLDALLVTCGPGSFTAIRASLALMQGLAMGSGKPLVGIPSMQTYALAWQHQHAGSRCAIVLESWREERFWALSDAPEDIRILSPQDGARFAQGLPVVGSGLEGLSGDHGLMKEASHAGLDFGALLQALRQHSIDPSWLTPKACFVRPPDVDT